MIMSRGSSLYRRLLAYQVYGANTAVGKTVFSTILCKALARSQKTWYLKPVSTGPFDEADDGHVKIFAPETRTKCLFQFKEAVSPHIAADAARNSSPPPSDTSIVDSILEYLQLCSQSTSTENGVVLVETAGGVHSPTPSGTSQADLYRPLRLPVFLVADPKLGGISSTISAFESLHVRGYDLASVFVFEDDHYKNHEYLSEYFFKRGIQTLSLPPPPSLKNNAKEDRHEMAAYYERMSKLDAVQDFAASCHQRHKSRIEDLESMASKAHKSIWYPFTQHQDLTSGNILTIDSAHGDFFQTLAPISSSSEISQDSAESGGEGLLHSTFDASASWWTQGLGHGSAQLSLAAGYAAGRYGHVMFAGAINEPALSLAELLLKNLKNPRLQKVFYSDDGSTGVEVAVKMALTASSKRYGWDIEEIGKDLSDKGLEGEGKPTSSKEIGIIGLKGSYHGDTIGAMDCSEGSIYNDKVHWYEGRGYWFDFPQVKMKDGDWILELPSAMEEYSGTEKKFGSLGDIFAEARDQSTMRDLYETYIKKTLETLVHKDGKRFGAVVLEPIILGAGGMLFCDPLFQRTLVNVVRSNPQIFGSIPQTQTASDNLAWQGLPIVFDEVFTGIYRLGRFTPSSLLHIYPDISVHAKLLTGGLVPLCVTIASNSIYDAFLSDKKSDALLHGHSYTAHAVGCEVARVSVQTMLDMDQHGDWEIFKSDWAEAGQATNIWSAWSKEFISRISRTSDVESVVTLGSVLAITLRDSQNKGYASTAASGLQKNLLEMDMDSMGGFNIHSRVLGNVLYLMASQTSEVATLRAIEAQLMRALKSC